MSNCDSLVIEYTAEPPITSAELLYLSFLNPNWYPKDGYIDGELENSTLNCDASLSIVQKPLL